MPARLKDARNLSEKLTRFRRRLSAGEQRALDALLVSFIVRAAAAPGFRKAVSPTGNGLVSLPEGSKTIEEIKARIRAAQATLVPPVVFATPAWTLTTLTTTLASHPVITCKDDDDVPILKTLTVKFGCEIKPVLKSARRRSSSKRSRS